MLASGKAGPDFDLTKEQIFRALAVELPDGNGGWIANPNEHWSDVSPDLPEIPIYVYGPPPTSGTRDAFVEIAMELGAEEVPEMAALEETDPDAFARRATTIRTDDAWVDAGENDTALIQTLTKNPNVVSGPALPEASTIPSNPILTSTRSVTPTPAHSSISEGLIRREAFEIDGCSGPTP